MKKMKSVKTKKKAVKSDNFEERSTLITDCHNVATMTSIFWLLVLAIFFGVIGFCIEPPALIMSAFCIIAILTIIFFKR